MTIAWVGVIPPLMINTKTTKMVLPKKIFRQHNSLVVVLPILIRRKLGIKKGDYLLFEWTERSKKVKIDRFRGNSKNE